MMAAGVVTVAHRSGGPREDIVVPVLDEDEKAGVGYLADDEDCFAAALVAAATLSAEARRGVVGRARVQAARFSDEAFARGVEEAASSGLFGPCSGC